MPVTPEEWESGAAYTPLAKGILSFLRENSPVGYSVLELYNMLSSIGDVHGFDGSNILFGAVQETLAGLAADAQIESKKLKTEKSTEKYYRAVN